MAGRVYTGEIAAGCVLGVACISSAVGSAQITQLARWKRGGVGEYSAVCGEYTGSLDIAIC